MRADLELCGTSFGLKLARHRLFELSTPPIAVTLLPPCRHRAKGSRQRGEIVSVFGHGGDVYNGVATWREAMGIDWMTRDELSQAIPPAYCEFIGKELIAAIEHADARGRAYSSRSRTLDISSFPDPETSYDPSTDVLGGNASSGCLLPSMSAVTGASSHQSARRLNALD